MLLTLTTTHRPATDLGFLLHKNPARPQSTAVSVGTAHVLYPEATEQRCTVALLLEVDPIALVRGRAGGTGGAGPEAFSLAQYVNDRPYAASSMLAVALGKVFSSARRGVSKERPQLVETPIPLEVCLPAVPCRGGAALVERFFAPLGWQVEATPLPLDERFPEWGDSRYLQVRLTGTLRVADALNHLYVGLPVLDDGKHYWVSTDEVDKLLRAGQGWLTDHPERDLITRRYLAHQGSLARQAMARLAEVDDTDPEVLDDATAPAAVGAGAASADADVPVPLVLQRHGAVLAALRSVGARRVVDLGCGAGALLPALLSEPGFTEVVGVDVSHRALQEAARRLRLDRMPERTRDRLQLLQGALTYTDKRLVGYDAAVLMEVVEHLDPDRLPALEHAVFGFARPGSVVVTTPNAEHNVRYPDLPAGAMRHRDHRFEWTRAEFAAWAQRVADAHGYGAQLLPVGVDDPEVGPPTQMAVFTRAGSSPETATATDPATGTAGPRPTTTEDPAA